jgi:hypothetical protein
MCWLPEQQRRARRRPRRLTLTGPAPHGCPPCPLPAPQLYSRATDRKATLYTLRIQTPPTATRLVAPEKTALAQLVADCCDVRKAMDMGATNVDLCARV